jgi:predicted NBD/HSP70 family sugar kinase
VIADIKRWYDLEDEDTLVVLKNFQASLSIILQNILLLFDPEKIVLSSKILRAIPELLPEVENLMSNVVNHPINIEMADSTNNDNLLGGCALITRSILELPKAELKFKKRTVPSVD